MRPRPPLNASLSDAGYLDEYGARRDRNAVELIPMGWAAGATAEAINLWISSGTYRLTATAAISRLTKGIVARPHFTLRQIAEAVDGLGFAGALLLTGRSCEDA